MRTLDPDELPRARRLELGPDTLVTVAAIVGEIKSGGECALRRHAERLGDIEPGQPLWITRDLLDAALDDLPQDQQQLLHRVADRIRAFARMQKECLREGELQRDGMAAGHSIAPVERAGCYAPGGRFPLPSSALMTAITAREAGVSNVVLASPHPAQITQAAAAVAGVDSMLAVGGAQAIAALAYGAGDHAPCDIVVGPGNRYVTAAKKLVSGDVGLDFLAGPSELVVLADEHANPSLVASDLLAQAEHDDDALPVLVTTHRDLIHRVNAELETQLADLPKTDTARNALNNGFAVLCEDLEQSCAVCDSIAPEHLALHTTDPEDLASRLNHYGALFLGERAAEVFGDYGTGPNHVLPTGGVARYSGGLSVFTFLRVRTWMRCQDTSATSSLTEDTASFARLEGLEAHARSAERRR